MQGAAPAVVAGVERGQEVDHLGAADLADDQPVGSHPQRLADQRAQLDRARALDVGRPALEPDDVRVVGTQLGGVLDEDQPLGRVDQREQRREQGGLAAAGAAGDQEGDPRRDQRAAAASAPRAVSVPAGTSSSRAKTRVGGTRSEIVVPGRDTGASTAWQRLPSGSRRSTKGAESSSRRPADGGEPLGESAHRLVVGEPHPGRLETRPAVDVDLARAR